MDDLRRLEPYTLHICDISYFSGKVQAHLACKCIAHRTYEITSAELVERVAPRTGLVEVRAWLERDGTLDHRYPEGDALPHCRPRQFSAVERLRLRVFGTPHHLEAGGDAGP
jgi:hypothetical protein